MDGARSSSPEVLGSRTDPLQIHASMRDEARPDQICGECRGAAELPRLRLHSKAQSSRGVTMYEWILAQRSPPCVRLPRQLYACLPGDAGDRAHWANPCVGSSSDPAAGTGDKWFLNPETAEAERKHVRVRRRLCTCPGEEEELPVRAKCLGLTRTAMLTTEGGVLMSSSTIGLPQRKLKMKRYE